MSIRTHRGTLEQIATMFKTNRIDVENLVMLRFARICYGLRFVYVLY